MKKPNPKIFTSIDLELNNPKSTQDIIQIGAVIGNIETGEILDRFSVNINTGTKLEEFITELTGITQEEHDKGMSLVEAVDQLIAFHKSHDSHTSPITWGNGDIALIKDHMLFKYSRQITEFGWTQRNVKDIFQFICLAEDKGLQSGLSKSMNRLGLKFVGTKHTAEADAENTFRVFKYLYDMTKANNEERDIIVDNRRISG